MHVGPGLQYVQNMFLIEKTHLRSLIDLVEPVNRLIRAKIWLQIVVGIILGIAVGSVLNEEFGWVSASTGQTIGAWLALPGTLFLAFIQMIVVPLIFSSIIRGIAAASDLQQLKTTGLFLAIYFVVTTFIAAFIGIAVGEFIEPGARIEKVAAVNVEAVDTSALSSPLSLKEIPKKITSIVPSNPLSSLVQGDLVQIVIFAIVFGIALLMLTASSAKPLFELLGSIQEVCMVVVSKSMLLAPYAAFGLLAQSMINTGPQVLLSLGLYSVAVLSGLTLLYVFYILVAKFIGKMSIVNFIKASREPLLIAFSTNSSAATMPITVKSAEQHLKIHPSISQFTIPLGATINMDATALYQTLATLFIAQLYHVDLPLTALVALVFTALGASVGTPAVPGVGIIVLAGVLKSVGIPLDGLTLIIGVDRILERFRSALNVTGDLVACTVMAQLTPSKNMGHQEVSAELSQT